MHDMIVRTRAVGKSKNRLYKEMQYEFEKAHVNYQDEARQARINEIR